MSAFPVVQTRIIFYPLCPSYTGLPFVFSCSLCSLYFQCAFFQSAFIRRHYTSYAHTHILHLTQSASLRLLKGAFIWSFSVNDGYKVMATSRKHSALAVQLGFCSALSLCGGRPVHLKEEAACSPEGTLLWPLIFN